MWGQVQVYLGHADYATTRRFYIHLVPKDLPERTSLLGKGANGVGTPAAETVRDSLVAPEAKTA